MKIAIVAAEISPYAKAGGLADVIGALPGALQTAGAQASVVLPGYRALRESVGATRRAGEMSLRLGAATERFSVLRADDPQGVPLYLIDHPGFFGRDGVYGDERGAYPDNLKRYIFFGRAAAAVAAEMISPDVLHAHDWHAAAAPIVMRADASLRDRFAKTLTIFTIHNLAFQGLGDPDEFDLLGIDRSYFAIEWLEFYGRVNLMKGAAVLADGVSTVSPAYAREVTTDPELGFGLDGVLRARGDRFVGIINGADYHQWDPATDMFITAVYSPARPEGKRQCANDLRTELKLPARVGQPLIGMVTRMTAQKGLDLLRDGLDRVMALEVAIAMLASGDAAFEDFFRKAEQRYPGRLRVVLGFDDALAHRIQAGADMFLMPSRFEPCGLTQMYAMRYGAVPVVRATGGLRDTVTEFNPETQAGTGFVFDAYAPEPLVSAISRAAETYRKPQLWRRLVANCFAQDFSWPRAARSYLEWFETLRRQTGRA
ncbi:MAG: glycogen synthase GlgA [Candidatus Binataceae bacterium]